MIVQVKQGLGIPTAISEIMRAKAAAAVAQIRKKESLLAGAVVAGSIVLGGIACQDNNGGDEPSIPTDTTITDTTITDTTKVDTSEIDEIADEIAKYKVYMGDILLIISETRSNPLDAFDTLGWAKVYTKNGWGTFETGIVVELENGVKFLSSTAEDITKGKAFIQNTCIPGYEGMFVKSAPGVWREPQLDKAKLDAKKPDEQGL